jgi:hypothetical protein
LRFDGIDLAARRFSASSDRNISQAVRSSLITFIIACSPGSFAGRSGHA